MLKSSQKKCSDTLWSNIYIINLELYKDNMDQLQIMLVIVTHSVQTGSTLMSMETGL